MSQVQSIFYRKQLSHNLETTDRPLLVLLAVRTKVELQLSSISASESLRPATKQCIVVLHGSVGVSSGHPTIVVGHCPGTEGGLDTKRHARLIERWQLGIDKGNALLPHEISFLVPAEAVQRQGPKDSELVGIALEPACCMLIITGITMVVHYIIMILGSLPPALRLGQELFDRL
jgi:hypothetical protein